MVLKAVASSSSGGTVTSVSGATAGGYAVSVATGTTTPVVSVADNPAINAQTGTTYTFVLADADNKKLVTLSNASAITATVPTNASVAFPVGAEICLAQIGAGLVTIAAAGGVTINTISTLSSSGQYAVMGLKKTATDTWLAFGALA